jgi:cytochrome bd-type quinol oxidase subunit 2
VTAETLARAASFASDVLVPLVQAVTTGCLVGGFAVFPLAELAPGWDVDPFKVWCGVALAMAAAAWLRSVATEGEAKANTIRTSRAQAGQFVTLA